MEHKTSFQYAKALFELSRERKLLEKTRDDARALLQITEETPEFIFFLRSPLVNKSHQNQLVQTYFAERLHPLTASFLFFLIQKERLYLLGNICERFEELCLKETRTLKVKIVSPLPLREKQVQAILDKIKLHFSKNVLYEMALDPKLLGGFKIQIRDLIYDYSIQTQLQNFRKSVLAF